MTEEKEIRDRARRHLRLATRFDGGVYAFPHDALISDLLSLVESSRRAGIEALSVEDKLRREGVFLGEHGLQGLADADRFWDKQPYGTRLYYGDGITDYLHRGVLQAAIRALENTAAQAQQNMNTGKVCPRGKESQARNEALEEAELAVVAYDPTARGWDCADVIRALKTSDSQT